MLIKCPECGREISDKAPHCIHCGFPLSEYKPQEQSESNIEQKIEIKEEPKIYRIATHGYNARNAAPAIEYLRDITDKSIFAISGDLKDCSRAIVKGLTYDQAVQVRDTLLSMEVDCEIREDDISEERDTRFDSMNLNRAIDTNAKNIIKCPRCGSTAVQIGNRGVTLTSGFWGASKTVNRCGNCGYKWKP